MSRKNGCFVDVTPKANPPLGSRVYVSHWKGKELGQGTVTSHRTLTIGPGTKDVDSHRFTAKRLEKTVKLFLCPTIKLDSGQYIKGYQCWWRIVPETP